MTPQEFLESDWDTCIVLDACRYDVFEDVYDEYLDGTLEKRESLGSSTPEWAYRTLDGDHDIAYFSGNPFINDLGIALKDLKWGASCDYDWTANDHIKSVIDVWQDEWDDDLGTVPPAGIEASYRDHADLVDERERTVLHYMQPHAPFLSRDGGPKLEQIQEGIKRQGDDDASQGPLGRIGDAVRPKMERLLEGSELAQKAGLWLETGTTGLLSDGTRETGLKLHEENLRIALEEIATLVEDLDGRVVVTADHGEAFGEEGVWEHHIETHIPALIDVPWLELD
ncbi:hypothetical protein [Halococcoides cellulosivorans]|uniref:Uncharacterized protein n=1 Tax=Halococcoides cellulosivorans TaxID=1679096 RepID=A0A2R4WXV1_9EURY|nr:hypothetical protein [Halococcoides cellulosivorans]AWB26372.1 hypothetical protein HARCEL1_00875 [Halococcoides cellulosivorans]